MVGMEIIAKYKEYLNYLEEHLNNVEISYQVIKDVCRDMSFMKDKRMLDILDDEINYHDVSKLSDEEFNSYRMRFFPTKSEKSGMSGLVEMLFKKAWKHHVKNNPHHNENWLEEYEDSLFSDKPNDWQIDCVHMIVDWMAMGIKFNDTAKDYYENNQDKLAFPDEVVDFIYKVFDRVYPN